MTEAMKWIVCGGSGNSGVAVQRNVDPGRDIDIEAKYIGHQAEVVMEQYANGAQNNLRTMKITQHKSQTNLRTTKITIPNRTGVYQNRVPDRVTNTKIATRLIAQVWSLVLVLMSSQLIIRCERMH